MLINGVPCAYQDYQKYIIVFSGATRSHFIIQDIYAEFFRSYIIEGLSKSTTVHNISDEYNVKEDIVSKDFDNFIFSLEHSCSSNISSVAITPTRLGVKESALYSLMSKALIPFSATIEVTDACNLKCIHCYRGQPSQSYWTLQTFEQALSQLRDLGTLHLTLTGGEPFSHPEFVTFLQLVKKYGFVLTIQTNATYDFSMFEDLLHTIPLKDIAISLYSVTSSVHDAITTVPGSCEQTMRTARLLAEKGFPVTINCPVMTINQISMEGVKLFADSISAPCHFSFKIIPCQESQKNTVSLNCFTPRFLHQCMVNPQIRLYHDILPDIRQTIPNERYCQTGFRSITIDAQGNVLLCNAYRKSCGRLIDSSISEIWSNSHNLIRWRTVTSFINETCKNCKAFAYCEPCPAHAFTLTGNEFAIDALTCSFGKSFYEADQCIKSTQKEVNKIEGI